MFATNRKIIPSPSHTVIDASGTTTTSTTMLQSRLRSKRFRGDIGGLSPEQFEVLLRRIGGPINQSGAPSVFGNPGPLGLGGFALSIFMFSVFNAGSYLIDPALLPVVYPAAFFYGGIAQFAAGMWEIRTNNTFGGVVFGSFGMFWIGLAVHFYAIVPLITGTGKTSIGTGFYLFSWLFFSLIVNAIAWVVSFLLFAILSGVSLTLLLLVIGCFAPSAVLIKIGGWTGLVTAFLAWYACGAVTFNTIKGRIVLPIGLRSSKKKKET